MPRHNMGPVSPSPPYGSMDHLLPPKEGSSLPQSIYQLVRSPGIAGKEDLVVVGAIVGLLLAGVLVGAAFLPKGEGPDRMAALRKKFTATETEPTTATTKHAEKTKTRRLDPRDEEEATDQLEAEREVEETAEESTVLYLEEERRTTKKAKARRKPKSRSVSVRSRFATEE
ncbi:uncharacterized protein LOC144123450 [Amblyomma americanum]